MSNICVIPARGGSKGIKHKNMRVLKGKPLLNYTIKCALDSGIFDKVFVSSDDDRILREAKKNGAESFKRSNQNSGDSIHAVHAIIELIKKLSTEVAGGDIVYMLLPTSPLRIAADLIQVSQLIERENNSNVVSVKKANCYVNNLRFITDNELLYVNSDNEIRNLQRQDQQELYIVNGSIFTSQVTQLLQNGTFHQAHPLAYVMPDSRSIDINSEEDFLKAEEFLNQIER